MRAQRGFTIVEMMVALTLMALLLGVAAVNFHGPRGRADSKGAAVVLASALRQARQQALSQGRTVALGFATDNASSQHSSGFYQLIGEIKPQVVTCTSFTNEYSGVGVFCGQYDGPTWTTTYPPQLSLDNFTLAGWLAPYPQDHVVAFLPNGLAVSDLPLGDGAYRLVVARSFSYSGTPATLTAAEEARTVSIRPSGEISEDNQVPGATAVVYQPGSLGVGATVPPVASGANAPPVLVTPFLKLNPDVNPALVAAVAPAGSTATVPPSGMLTFTVYAQDPDGDQLWCKWSGPGTFSAAEGSRMVWDEANKRWVGEWSWRVPKGAAPNDIFDLVCKVYDNHGGVTTPVDVGLSMPKPAVISGQSLLCAMLDGAYRWNWDGTGAECLVRSDEVGNKQITKARWSPDCGSVAVVAQNEIYLVSPEGKNLQLLDTFTKNVDAICWDRDGLHLYALVGDDLISLQPDPTAPGRTTLISGLGLNRPTSLNMHPTTKLLVTSDDSATDFMTIWLPDAANGDPGPVTYRRVPCSPDQTHSPLFDQGGTLFYRCREDAGGVNGGFGSGGGGGLCSMRSPVTINPVARSFAFSGSESAILNSVGAGIGYTVSPDGLYIAGGLPGDRLAICPVTGTSLADTIDVTAVPPTATRKVVDIDWGFY